MGKRGNDMSQLSKEEYEAAMERGSSSGNGFSKASAEVLKGRRILKTTSKWRQSKAAAASASQSTTTAPSLGGSGGGASASNPFSNFSFTKASTSTSLTAPSIAAKAQNPSPGSSKPLFAMPSLPTNIAANSNKTLSLSDSLLSSKANTQQSSGEKSNNSQLSTGFKEFIAQQDIRRDWELPMSRFINTYNQKLKESKQSSTTSSAAMATISTATKPSTSTFGGFGGTSGVLTTSSTNSSSISSKPLFPPSTSAPASTLFSFSAPASSSGTSQKPTFSFGNAATSSPAPATSSSTTGFGFAFGGKTSSTGSATTPTTSTNPSETQNQDSASNNEEDGDAPLQSADEDWNQVYSTKVKVYHHRDKSAGAKGFASGELKLQELKADASVKRMVMRDIAGKVTLNVSVSSSMNFNATRSQKKNGKTVARVQFFGIVHEKAELLTIVCKAELLDEFHGKLIEMSS